VTLGWLLNLAGLGSSLDLSPELRIILVLNFASFIWRVVSRYAFTAREYGWAEGLRAVVRIPVANVIAIMAGRRALVAYAKALAGPNAAESCWPAGYRPEIECERQIGRGPGSACCGLPPARLR